MKTKTIRPSEIEIGHKIVGRLGDLYEVVFKTKTFPVGISVIDSEGNELEHTYFSEYDKVEVIDEST